jgi:hypothetical protein
MSCPCLDATNDTTSDQCGRTFPRGFCDRIAGSEKLCLSQNGGSGEGVTRSSSSSSALLLMTAERKISVNLVLVVATQDRPVMVIGHRSHLALLLLYNLPAPTYYQYQGRGHSHSHRSLHTPQSHQSQVGQSHKFPRQSAQSSQQQLHFLFATVFLTKTNKIFLICYLYWYKLSVQ